MISTVESARPLTSLGIPARVKCSRLLPKGRAGSRRTELWLLVAAVVLPLVAVGLAVHDVKYSLGFVLCLALVCAVLARPVFGGFLLVALVPAISGLAPGVLTPTVRPSEALVGLVGATILIGTRRLAAVRWGFLEWLLLAYGLVWAVLGAYDAVALGEHLSFSSFGTLIGQLQFFLLYRSVRLTLRTPRQRMHAVIVLMVVTVPLTVLAMLQEVNVGGLRTLLSTWTGNASPLQLSGIIRATSLFGNWAALAGYLFPILLVLVALGLSGRIRRHAGAAIAVGMAMVVGLLLTAELSVIICLVIGLVVMGIQYHQSRRLLTWFVVVAAISLVFVGPVIAQRISAQFGQVAGTSTSSIEPHTVAFRQSIWTSQYIPAIAERPLTGYGAQLPSTVSWPYPESQYIDLLTEGGYPLLVMYLCLIVGMLVQANRAARSPDTLQRAIGRALLISVVSLLLLGITWPFLSNGGMPQVLWCLFALAAPAQAAYRAPPGTAKLVSLADPFDD